MVAATNSRTDFPVDEVGEMAPTAIVVSPGPCAPAQAGVSVPVIQRWGRSIPTLGVCLGHQAIGEAYGGRPAGSEELARLRRAVEAADLS